LKHPASIIEASCKHLQTNIKTVCFRLRFWTDSSIFKRLHYYALDGS